MASPLLDLLAPPRCLVCRRRGPMPWCPPCAPPRRTGPTCGRCDARLEPVDGGPGEPAVTAPARCPLAGSDVAGVVAAHDYRGAVATVVRTAKLEGCVAAYGPLASGLGRVLIARGPAAVDVVTAIPVPRRRRRRRGFDHAALLARGVARELGRPVLPLLAVRGTAPDRGAGGRGVPRMVADREVAGRVLVVDDVVTTGATARAAATVLARAGATEVWAAAVARAGGHPG